MPVRGAILPDMMPVNKYQLIVPGLPALTFTTLSGMEEELEKSELPDRTVASGGNTKAQELTATQPMHHTVEVAAMELWFKQGQDPVSPGYKKAATLIHKSNSGAILRTYSLIGMFAMKRKLPDLDMANEGEMAVIEWTFSVDAVLPA